MERRFFCVVMMVGCTMASVSCGGKQQPQNGARSTAEAEFARCMEQEKYGEAKGCWHFFLEHNGDAASVAELAYAQKALKEQPLSEETEGIDLGEDAVARAARTMQSILNLEDSSGLSSTSPDGFPPRRVAFDECYKGFRVTGNSERDVMNLGERCGVPCGMIPFSGIMSGSQGEDDQVDVYGIDLRSDRCYRIFAVGEGSIDDLDSAIADSEGNVLIRDVFEDSAPILGPEGPFCPTVSGHYKYIVSVAKGAGTFHFQVWQGARL